MRLRKKDPRGRKPIADGSKKIGITVYLPEKLILELGGAEKLKEKITIAVELKEI